jgi:hypothetical protein
VNVRLALAGSGKDDKGHNQVSGKRNKQQMGHVQEKRSFRGDTERRLRHLSSYLVFDLITGSRAFREMVGYGRANGYRKLPGFSLGCIPVSRPRQWGQSEERSHAEKGYILE